MVQENRRVKIPSQSKPLKLFPTALNQKSNKRKEKLTPLV
jgi:hypothetical protein